MDQRGYAFIRGEGFRGEGWIRGGMLLLEGRGGSEGCALIRGERWIRGGMPLLAGRVVSSPDHTFQAKV